ncbi:MAG: hypothetical protein MJ071_09055 [Oscillospiraceae bacterium]|nr:hypothetical protein [Oscillospiraceae bacterium]
MNHPEILTAILALVFTIPIPIILIVCTVLFIKQGQKKHPPYHKTNAMGDVTVYLFEWSRGSKSLSDEFAGKYQEYLFVNTVNGFKYQRSDKKKLADILFFALFTVVLLAFLFPCISEGAFHLLYFSCLFAVYAFAILMLFSIEYANFRLAKKYLKENCTS